MKFLGGCEKKIETHLSKKKVSKMDRQGPCVWDCQNKINNVSKKNKNMICMDQGLNDAIPIIQHFVVARRSL